MSFPVTLGGVTFTAADFAGYAYSQNWGRFLAAFAQTGAAAETSRVVAETSRAVATEAAAAAAASLATAQQLTGPAVAMGGPGALALQRGADIGSAAYWQDIDLVGRFILQRDAAYQILPQDFGKLLLALAGTPTYTLPLAANVPIGWWVEVKARGTTITVARAGADTVDGSTSLSVTTGTSRRIIRSGATSFESA